MIWSIACMAKLKVMNSTIGRRPLMRGADGKPGEAVLGDRRVDDAARAELVQHALADLVGALVLRDLLAHQEHALVGAHLLGHRVAQRLAHGDCLTVGRHSFSAAGAAARRARGGGAPPRQPARARRAAGAVGLGRRRTPPGSRPLAPALSPSPASTAIGVFTATPSVPSGTRIWAILPSSTASTSIVALSVSISAITSPG